MKKRMVIEGIALILLVFSIFFIENRVEGWNKKEQIQPTKVEAAYIEPVVKQEVKEKQDSFYGKYKENKTPLQDQEYFALLNTCLENNIEPTLAMGLIDVESKFNPNAKSKSGCYGYCQLNPKYFGKRLSPEQNIVEGIEYLAYQFDRYKNLESGLTAYNVGHDTKNTSYARAVLKAADKWEEIYS